MKPREALWEIYQDVRDQHLLPYLPKVNFTLKNLGRMGFPVHGNSLDEWIIWVLKELTENDARKLVDSIQAHLHAYYNSTTIQEQGSLGGDNGQRKVNDGSENATGAEPAEPSPVPLRGSV